MPKSKFQAGDIIKNQIKAHPRCEFFVWDSKIFYNNFKSLGIETNSSYGNFLLINFNKIRGNAKKIFLKLAKKGILVRKMDVYKIKNSLRITIGNNFENKKFINTLRKII